jgi:hypothetical protein
LLRFSLQSGAYEHQPACLSQRIVGITVLDYIADDLDRAIDAAVQGF